MQAHTNRKPVPPIALNSAIPESLNDAILKSLAKEPSKRFADAEEFRKALDKVQVADSSAKTPAWNRLPEIIPVWMAKISVRRNIHLPDFRKLIGKKYAIDRRTFLSVGFLAGSILLALLLFFYKPSTGDKKVELTKIADTSVVEPYLTVVEPEIYTRPATVSSPPKDNPIPDFGGKKKDPEIVKTPPETKTPVRETPKEKKAEAKAEEKAKVEAEEKEKAKEKAKEKQQTPVAGKETPPNRASEAVGRQIVINRGTQIEVRLDNPLDYETATHGARVSLTVASPLVRSERTVVNSGAKATAIVHKDTRRKELTLEMVEAESVEGQKLKTFNTKYSARQFQQNETFKMYLEWNRVRVRN
jgi:hypothetical protein